MRTWQQHAPHAVGKTIGDSNTTKMQPTRALLQSPDVQQDKCAVRASHESPFRLFYSLPEALPQPMMSLRVRPGNSREVSTTHLVCHMMQLELVTTTDACQLLRPGSINSCFRHGFVPALGSSAGGSSLACSMITAKSHLADLVGRD